MQQSRTSKLIFSPSLSQSIHRTMKSDPFAISCKCFTTLPLHGFFTKGAWKSLLIHKKVSHYWEITGLLMIYIYIYIYYIYTRQGDSKAYSAGSTVSQLWYSFGKSTLKTCPTTLLTRCVTFEARGAFGKEGVVNSWVGSDLPKDFVAPPPLSPWAIACKKNAI